MTSKKQKTRKKKPKSSVIILDEASDYLAKRKLIKQFLKIKDKQPGGQPYLCLKCGYEWVSRKPNPKACPYCKQYLKRK